MSRLDLSDLDNWDDTDLMQALTDIDDGLSSNDCDWIDRFAKAIENNGALSERQREVAESILRRWNNKQ